jgi:DNA invertase Pin-like site-specific DNA recombinase
VSSAEQGLAYGPEAQRRAIRSFARAEKLAIVAEVFEDRSGTLPLDERPGLQEAMAAALQHGAATLLVANRDRLARDERVAFNALEAFRSAGLRVMYADGSNGDDEGSMLLDGISHVIAAHERRRIVARLKAGRDAKAAAHPESRAQGGRVPYGYRRTATGLEINPEQAEHVRRIFSLIRQGKSIRHVTAILSERTGRRWQPTVVDRIVRREVYKLGRPARIVDPRLWNAAQQALRSRRKASTRDP